MTCPLDMPLQITEMQPTDFAEVMAFASGHDTAAAGPFDASDAATLTYLLQHNPNLNLVARHERQVVGLILCDRLPDGSYAHQMLLDPGHQVDGLQARLLNTAMRKMQSRGIHKVRVAPGTALAEDASFWDQLHWDADGQPGEAA